jgi:polysaccharide pyruvyl transferase WcaK-like protein
MIALVQDVVPNAQITSLSQFPERDAKWFGIEFLPISPYSTSPVDYLKLLSAARGSDVILWGGGELLKDYTNRLSLYYWLLKLWGIKMVNPNIIGAFQGIGPTKAKASKKAIVRAVNQCKTFIVRDIESELKLERWGAKAKLIASYDPAVYPKVNRPETQNYMGFGLRRWFHYEKSGWLPNKYKFWKKASVQSEDELHYIESLAAFADSLIDLYECDLRFFPMHMSKSEDDVGFAKEVIAKMQFKNQTSILETDDLSPSQYLAAIGECRVFIASRLHSAILAAVVGVPALCIYYVDKGRLFFEQMGLSNFSLDIERMREPGIVDHLEFRTRELMSKGDFVKDRQRDSILMMRKDMLAALTKAISDLK